MPSHHSFPSFEKELNRLVATFEKNFAHYKKPGYDEASLRQEFLNPLFSALGWDVENRPRTISATAPPFRPSATLGTRTSRSPSSPISRR